MSAMVLPLHRRTERPHGNCLLDVDTGCLVPNLPNFLSEMANGEECYAQAPKRSGRQGLPSSFRRTKLPPFFSQFCFSRNT